MLIYLYVDTSQWNDLNFTLAFYSIEKFSYM